MKVVSRPLPSRSVPQSSDMCGGRAGQVGTRLSVGPPRTGDSLLGVLGWVARECLWGRGMEQDYESWKMVMALLTHLLLT